MKLLSGMRAGLVALLFVCLVSCVFVSSARAQTVTGMSPTAGPVGTVGTVSGTGFQSLSDPDIQMRYQTSTVTIAVVTVVSDTTLRFTVPNEVSVGPEYDVYLYDGAVGVSFVDSYTATTPVAPTVTGLNRSGGPLAGGTYVLLTGTSFTNATDVMFGTIPATSFTVDSATQINARIPAGAQGTVNITVSTAAGTSATSVANQFTYYPVPVITSLTPSSGRTTSGATVVITGSGFAGAPANSVKFGTTNVAYTINSDTQITATAPGGAHLTVVNVRVTTLGGTTTDSTASQYTYAAAPRIDVVNPTSGSTAGGTLVNIYGMNLPGATRVAFGSIGADFAFISSSQIRATTPARAAGVVNIQITGPGGSSNVRTFTFNAPLPTVTAISTTSGSVNGGAVIVITGTGFTAATSVKFGSTAATTYTVDNDTQITATSPSGSAGTVNVQVTTAGGTNADSTVNQFTYIPPPSLTSFTYNDTVGYNSTSSVSIDVASDGNVTGVPSSYLASNASNGSFERGSFFSENGGRGAIDNNGSATYTPPTGFRGNDRFYVVASNAYGNSIPATVTVTVGDPTFTFGITGTGLQGSALSGASISVTGGAAPYVCASTLASGTLPAGVTLNTDCTITGTPTESGSFDFAVGATDSSTGTGAFSQPSGTLTLLISPPTIMPVITASPPVLSYNPNATFQFTLSNGTAECSIDGGVYASCTSPLSFAGLADGSHTLQVRSRNGGQTSAAASFNWTIDSTAPSAPVVNTPANGSSRLISARSVSGTAEASSTVAVYLDGSADGTATADGAGNWTYALSSLASGAHTVSARTSDAAGNTSPASATNSFTAVATLDAVQAVPALTVSVNTAMTTTQPVTTSGGLAPISYALSGATLPNGLAFSTSTGELSGTATSTLAATTFTVTATDAFAQTASQTFALTVDRASQTISFTSTAPVGAVIGGTPYTPSAISTSGLAVSFTIDASSSGVCSITSGVVSFVGTGTCRVNVDQTGDVSFAGAPQVQQSFAVGTNAPTLTSAVLYPSGGSGPSGPTIGGTTIQINGTNLSNVARVTIGGVSATVINGSNFSNSVRVTTPAGAAGPADIVVTTQLGTSTLANGFTYVLQTAITSISPRRGPLSGGTQVTIDGANFTNATRVEFVFRSPGTSVAASFTVVNSTQIIATSPPSTSSQTVGIAVSANGATAVSPTNFIYSNPPLPTVSDVVPYAAPLAGGTSVTIYGSNFTGTTAVSFGGTAAASFTVVNASQITAVAPAGAAGGADIAVTTPDGTTTSSGRFSYEAEPVATDVVGVVVAHDSMGTDVDLTNVIAGTLESIDVATAPAHGTVTIGGAVVTYIPTVGYYGADSFTFTATGPGGTSSPATVSLAVAPPAAPVAADQSGIAIAFDSPGSAIALSSAVNGVFSSIAVGATPAHGTTSVAGAVVIYTPASGYYGADSFTYTATGPGGTSAPATVTLTVATPEAPVVTAPSAVAVRYNSNGTAIDLSGSVTGVATSMTVATTPAHGTTSVAGNVVTYTPAAGYYGTDSFTYTAAGPGGTSSPATVALTVATPATPVVTAPSGVSVGYNSIGTAVDLSSSVSGVSTSISVATAPAHGTASVAGNVVTYTPTAGYYGADSFTFTATGPGGTSSPVTVSLSVALPPAPTVAARSGISVTYNSTGTTVDLSSSVSGVSSRISVATTPAHGTTSVAGNVVTYTPAAGYYGADNFTFTATGPGGTSAPATVSLTVATPPAPVVTAPSAVAVGYNSNGAAVDLSGSVSGVASSILVATAPAHGTTSVAGNVVTYTSTAGYYGADSFTYTATGPGGTSSPASVSLIVATPAAPVVAARSGVAVAFNSQGTAIDLSSSVSGVSTIISVVTPPARGTTSVAGNVVTYTPNVDTYGADSFTFTATGPGGTSTPATVSLTVAGSAPRVQPQSGSTSDGQMVSIELTRGAAIGPFTAAQVVSVSPANAATTSITSTGDGAARRYFVEATAAARFGGTVTINYTLTNAFGVSPMGVVTLTVAARLDPSNDPKVRALTDAQVQATRRFGRSQIANFMRRNEQLHSGRARSSQNISVNIIDPTRERRPEDSMAPAVMPKRDSDKPDVTESHYAAPAAQDEKPAGVLGAMSMWVSGAIDIATRDASSFAPKLSATTQGISGGVDFQISKRTAIGFGAGYGSVTSNINAKAAELDATSNLVAVYGSTKLFENGFVDVVAGRGFLDYKTRRRIDGTEMTALGSRTGTMNLAAVSIGFNKQVEDLDWSFYSKLEYMDAKLAAYTETSGGPRNNLRLSALDDTSYSAGLGFRLQKAFATGIGAVTPRLRGEFGREFGKANTQYVDYADIAGATSRGIQGRLNEQNFYQTSIGTMIDLKSDWSFDLEYALMYNTATLSAGIKVQLSRAF